MAKKKQKPREIVVYIDGVDWQYELGEASGGNTVYPSLENLKQYNKCWEGCGAVKCKVIMEEWVSPQNIMKDVVSSKDYDTLKHDMKRLEDLQERRSFVEELIIKQKQKIKERKNGTNK